MMRPLRFLITIVALACAPLCHSEESPPGKVVEVSSRGTTVPIYVVQKENAVATVLLYSGGVGGYGTIGEDGWPASRNFLIRSAKRFTAYPFNLVLVGRAKDVPDLDGPARISDAHDEDNRAVFHTARHLLGSAPLWLVGTSRGTMSVAAAAIRDQEHTIAGIVLTSSVTAYRLRGSVPTQALEKIRVPTLVIHHARDACKLCAPWEAKNIVPALKNAPIKKTMIVDGGGGETGDPCEAFHFHGYIGMEKEAVDLIAEWIQHPSE
jgi:hypothetical protein